MVLPPQAAADTLTPVVPAYVFADDFVTPANTNGSSKRAREGTEQDDAARSTRRRALQDADRPRDVTAEDEGVNPWLSSAFSELTTAGNVNADESVIPATPTPPGRRPLVLIPDTPISMRRPASADIGILLPPADITTVPQPADPNYSIFLPAASDGAQGRDPQNATPLTSPELATGAGHTEEAMDVDNPPHTPHGKGKGREGQDLDCACATCLRRLAESLARGDAVRLDDEDAQSSQTRPLGPPPGPSAQLPIDNLNSTLRARTTTSQLHSSWNVQAGVASSSTQHTNAFLRHSGPQNPPGTSGTAPATNQLTRPPTPFFASTPRPGALLPRVCPPITAADLLPLGNQWGDGDILPTTLARGVNTQDHLPQPQTQEWPVVHRDDPEAMLRGLAIPWVETIWNDPAGTIALIEVFNTRYSSSIPQNRRTAAALRGAITSATNQTSFHLVPPELAQGVNPASRMAPSLWAARGLTEQSTTVLTEQRVWTARSISFFAYPRTLSIPSWLLSLEGFIDDNQNEIERTVSSVIRSARHYDQIVLMIRQSPEHALADPHEVARTILSTLDVRVITLGNGNIIANVYMAPPTRNIRRWRAWVQDLRSTRFGIYLTATATPRAISWCAGCRSADHPAHHCPFPMTQGWLGPDAGTGAYTTQPEQLGGGEMGNGIPPPAQPSTPVRRGGRRGGGRGRGGRAF